MEHSRKFNLRTNDPDFYAGKTADGQQVLMGLAYPDLLAFWFDRAGELVRVERRPAPAAAPPPAGGRPNLWSVEYERRLTDALAAWQSEFSFIDAPISVRPFNAEGVRIEARPEYYTRFLADPVSAESDEGERARTLEFVARWDRAGRFVLCWGTQYWMNRDGTVEST